MITKISYNLTHNVGRIVVLNESAAGVEINNPVIEELPIWIERMKAQPDNPASFRAFLETEGASELLSMTMDDYTGFPVSIMTFSINSVPIASTRQLTAIALNGEEIADTQFVLFATEDQPVSTNLSFSFLVPKIGTVFANDYNVVPSTGVTPAGAPTVTSVGPNYRLTFNTCNVVNGIIGNINIVPKV